MWPIISAITFYTMFALLLGLLFWMGRNLAIYARAWLTLVSVNKQQADSLQKVADAVYILAKKIDRLEFESKATREALQDEYSIFITVDGERVTIKNRAEPDTTRHIIRKPTKKTTAAVKKTEEGN